MVIKEITGLAEYRAALIELLNDSVAGGASVGFLPPLSDTDAANYWVSVEEDLHAGARRVCVAIADGKVVGVVQLALHGKANGNHRGEVEKLMVHSACRGRGIARLLMEKIEQCARDSGRSLLILDTRVGDVAEQLYRKIGYIEAGQIPAFARSAAGTLDATCIFYKQLEPAPSTAG
ncbi:GNAT family N-acetyltransferase [Microbulbifer hainanensis]|uniref:GNAT family N-acetyltransferase n=1 Tax=Microbulbifer hainanensis TaxID=2735675 RepID=UPI0018660F7F|nr:GNAT family N-acetyltransferase [Microbulbifer hainanensis]